MESTPKATVKVTGDAAGNIINVSPDNQEYGYIRVEQTRAIVGDDGWGRKKTLSALIPGKIEDLKAFDWKKDEMIHGKIQIIESLTPFNKKNPEKDYKIAGETGIVCCVDGAPIYRRTIFTENVNANDITLEHNNKEAIKAAYDKLKAEASGADLNQA